MIDIIKSSDGNAKIRYITVIAVMGALASVLMMLEISLPFIPFFLKFDFSDLPAFITAYMLGPIAGIIVELIKNLIHLPFSNSLYVGEAANFIIGIAYVIPIGLIFKTKKNFKTALISALIGSFVSAVLSVPVNYFITYPVYSVIYMPMESIIGIYKSFLPPINSLLECLLIFNLPFTLAKGLIDALITILLYKKLEPLILGKKH